MEEEEEEEMWTQIVDTEDVTLLDQQMWVPEVVSLPSSPYYHHQRRCDLLQTDNTVQSPPSTALQLPHSSSSTSPSPSQQPGTLLSLALLLCATLALLIETTSALHITSYSIPSSVDGSNGSQAVTLDCKYAFDGADLKLVVRWFHNDAPEPIYQWIPEPDVRYIGELIRPYFDVAYQVPGGDRFSRYRALRLLGRLPVALGGNYTCVISSIASTVDQRGRMVVYVPPAIFDFNFIELGRERIALQCLATGVYPRPTLSFTETTSSNASYRHRAPPVNVTISTTPSDDENDEETSKNFNPSLYSASFLYPVNSVLSAGTVYECRLALPGTSYARKKRIKIIFPTTYSGKIPGGPYANGRDKSLSLSFSGAGTRNQNANFGWTLLFALVISLFIHGHLHIC